MQNVRLEFMVQTQSRQRLTLLFGLKMSSLHRKKERKKKLYKKKGGPNDE